MSKNALFKIISVMTALCICSATVSFGTLAESGQGSTQAKAYKYVPIEIKDFTGIAHSTTGGSSADFPRYYVNTSNRDAARPRIASAMGLTVPTV